MKQNKTWFVGYTSRLWVPVSFEGWLATAAFFVGIFIIGKINNVPKNTSLNVSQIMPILFEFIILIIILYFVTKGHVDKRY